MDIPDTQAGFRELIEEHSYRTGFEMPLLLEHYLAALLESRLESSACIVTEPSLADCYLMNTVKQPWLGIKYYADQCLFFSSILPELDTPGDIAPIYWAHVGAEAYLSVGDYTKDLRFDQLAIWFVPLQRFLSSMIRSDLRIDLTTLYSNEINTRPG